MKSIFKKIAFVLALAMVVTMMPAKAAAAAESDGPQMYKTLKLYVGGDVTGNYPEQRYAKVWEKDGYEVEFESSDESVATVNSKGYVTAVNVGSATVTATFTSEDGSEEVVRTCAITVKRNAERVGLNGESAKKVAGGIAVGEEYQLTGIRKVGDNTEWNKSMKQYSTDSVRFSSSDPNILDVRKTTGKITGVSTGTVTLRVWGVQSEGFDEETGEYPLTVFKEYEVEVYEAGIVSAKQVNWNTVAITCGSAAVAANLVANKEKLSVSYKLGENNITTYINYNTVAVDSSDDKVVNVSLYDDMVKDYVYTFKYNDSTVDVTGADLTAVASIRIDTATVVSGESKDIVVKYYDEAGIELPAGTGSLSFSVSGGDTDYFFLSENSIYFVEEGKTALIKATYIRGYKEDGSPDEISDTRTIASVAASTENNQIVGWAIDGNDANVNDLSYNMDVKNIAVGDTDRYLYGRYVVTLSDGKEESHYTRGSSAVFEYTSTNDSVVMVNSLNGELSPVAAGTATIIVRRVYDDTNKPVVGVCTIRVAGSRTLTSFTATANKNKLAINPDNSDSVTISTSTKDQLGGGSFSDVDYKVEVSGLNRDLTLTINNVVFDSENLSCKVSPDGDGNYKVTAAGTDITATVRISITATQANDRSITRVVTLSVKSVKKDDIVNYVLEVEKTNIDLNFTAFGDNDGLGRVKSTIKLVAYDRNGFYVKTVEMQEGSGIPANNGDYSYVIMKGSKNVSDQMLDGKDFSAVAVSGSAVSGGAITKHNTGVYTVMVYHRDDNGNVNCFTFKNIVVGDSTAPVVANVNNTNIVSKDFATLKSKMTFFRGGTNISDNIEIIGVEMTESNDRIYVSNITVREKITTGNAEVKGLTYEYKINIGKTFYYNY